MHINLSGMALLPWEPNALSVKVKAFQVMSSPVVTFDDVMKVSDIYRLVFDQPHHAFPIVEGERDPVAFNHGRLIGMISSQHIALMLKKKVGTFCLWTC